MIYDAAIIGSGPAGLSAALNLKIHNKNILWLGNPSLSDKAARAEEIRNYPGLGTITGPELIRHFQEHMAEMELSITDAMVTQIMSMGDSFALMAGSDFYQAKTVLLATGAASMKTLPGEEALLGRGVSYCATCDGNLYRGKRIGVILSNPRFAHEVAFLAGLAAEVYLFAGGKDPQISGENIHLMTDKPLEMLSENGRFTGLSLKSGETLLLDGIFCLRDSIALTSLIPGLETEGSFIKVDRTMATNLPGVYAAGDCTGRPYQFAKAVGEGNVAAHSMIEYLAK